MMNPRMTFGEHLKQFALSIDFIEPMHYQLVQEHIKKYLELQLNAVQVGFFERTVVDDTEGMTTVWSFPTFSVHQTLLGANRKYRRQLALALGHARNLWVISKNGERLSPSNPGADVWDEQHEDSRLPPFYVSPHGQPSQTAITLITRDARGLSNGAFLVEIGDPIRPSRVLKREMSLLADAVGLLHATDAATREQREGTNSAIATLADLVRQLELDTGPRPLLFLAYSHRAMDDVMTAIQQVLDDFKDYVFARHWREMHSPGNINVQLADEIRRAQFGICYLSEKNPDAEKAPRIQKGSPIFRDNANVLVEAGMLHMVTQATTAAGTGWIPVRERDSPPAPFDLENQRTVLVDRNKRGELEAEQFKRELGAKLLALLGLKSPGVTPSPSPSPTKRRRTRRKLASHRPAAH